MILIEPPLLQPGGEPPYTRSPRYEQNKSHFSDLTNYLLTLH